MVRHRDRLGVFLSAVADIPEHARCRAAGFLFRLDSIAVNMDCRGSSRLCRGRKRRLRLRRQLCRSRVRRPRNRFWCRRRLRRCRSGSQHNRCNRHCRSCHMGNGSPLLFFSFGPLYHPYYHSSVLKHICAYRCLFPSMNDRRGLPRFGIPLRSFIFYIYTFSAVP